MPATSLVSVEEYLNTSYDDGDLEYVDGELLERQVGEIDHSDLQTSAALFLRIRYGGIAWVGVEARVQVAARRFRIPDVCVALGAKPSGQVITSPPFLVIEVLSPEDRATRVQTKIADYLDFGVSSVWVIDPAARSGISYTRGGVDVVSTGSFFTSNPVIELPLAELFV